MKYALAIVAAAGLASVANAATSINFDVSLNGTDWSSSVNAGAGSTVYVRMRVALTTPGASQLGLSGFTAQPVLSNWNGADVRNAFTFPGLDNTGAATTETAYEGRHVREQGTQTGRMFPFGSGGQGPTSSSGLLTSFVDGGNRLRFAGSKNTTETTNVAWGVAIAQNPASLGGTNYNGELDVTVFRYSITLGAGHTENLVASAVQVSGNVVKWYNNTTGTSVLNDNAITINPGTIVIPAPGALALLGMGGLAAARRRRA